MFLHSHDSPPCVRSCTLELTQPPKDTTGPRVASKDEKWRQQNGFQNTRLGDRSGFDGPPGITDNPSSEQIRLMREFDALRAGKESYITFAGGGETVEFSHSVAMASSSSVEVNLELDGGMAW